MKRRARLTSLVLVGMIFLAGCSGGKEAKETTSVLSLRYGVGHYSGFEKTVIAVSSDLSLIYHVYPAEVEDDEINYDGIRRLGPALPIVEIASTIPQDQWDALTASKSLKGVWGKSKAAGIKEEFFGVEAMVLVLTTPTTQKTVGGYVIGDQWIRETSLILEQLARNNGALQQGEEKREQYLAQKKEEDGGDLEENESPPLG